MGFPSQPCLPGLSEGRHYMRGRASLICSFHTVTVPGRYPLKYRVLLAGMVTGAGESGDVGQRQSFLACSGRMSGRQIGQATLYVHLGLDGR